jgi:hypothetical protein
MSCTSADAWNGIKTLRGRDRAVPTGEARACTRKAGWPKMTRRDFWAAFWLTWR